MAKIRHFFKTFFKLEPVPVVGRTGTVVDPQCPNLRNQVECHEVTQINSAVPVRLPKGLVGSRCTANIKIAGEEFDCLLDTGSQVTTIPVSFYNQHFADQPVKSLCDLLQVEGAAGQAVPYLGYVEMVVTFPSEFLGVDLDVSTLALVVPDVGALQSPVLIGMNTLEPLYKQYTGSEYANFQPTAHGYKAVLKLLQIRHQQQQVGSDGVVRLASKSPIVIPAGHTTLIDGFIHASILSSAQWGLVEHPASPLPGGLCVKNSLVMLPSQSHKKIPVILSNESDQDVIIPPLSIIGELAVSPQILSHTVSTSCSPSGASPALKLDFGESPIPLEWKRRIIDTLNKIPDVFSLSDTDFGCTDKVKHHIKLHDETPFKHRARPIHPQDIEAVRQHLRDLLEAGVIRESESPFSSPIVVVRKKNGDIRLCIDYRKLNLQTVKDAYPLPNLEESLSALSGSKWFSVLDLKSGYYQIEMNEEDKAKTGFVTPVGFWEFNRMPQGVTNAPSTFQRLMEKSMGDLHLKEVLVFLDDLIVFSTTLEEHEQRLLRVLHRLKEYGLKLSPEKCKFFQTSVKYLGHIVSEKGVETDPDKILALKSWPIPRNLKELKSFLGFAGYYRRFIKGYSAIAKPLNDLTRGYTPTSKAQKRASPIKIQDSKQPFGGRWSPTCQLAFEMLIEKLTSSPVLGFADPKLQYILHTDASTIGLGAALYQEQEGQLRVIAYASRGLSVSESRYPAHKLEFLALKWSVCEKFHDYLYGANFVVVTDNNPLTYLLSTAKLDAASHRWLAALSTYTFKLQYRAGKQNLDADALSRRPHNHPADLTEQKDCDLINKFTAEHVIRSGELEELNTDIVSAICHRCLVTCQAASPIALVESLSLSAKAVPDCYASEDLHGLPVVPPLSHLDLKEKQRADPVIREVIHQMETGEKVPPTARQELPDLVPLLRELNRLELQDDILYRRRQDGEQVSFQLVLPEELRMVVITSLHDDMGHMGIERTLDLVRSRFFWPRMAADIETKIKTCNRCVRRKALPERSAPLVNIRTTRPLELLCMDYLSLEPDQSNTKDILVFTDHFTKFAIAIPTANQKAKTVAKCLWENFIVCYGIPERLHTDQGPDFESKLIKELCQLAGIVKTRTTPYHPRGNPVERFNRTLLNMLGTLEHKQKARWKDYVKPLVHAYNCTRNDVTGFTPYELMFGRSPRLPVDLAFGLPVRENWSTSHSKYVENLRSRLEESFQLASKNAIKSGDRNKARFDQRVTPSSLEEGDRVLVRNVRLRGKHKLEDKWEQDVYVVEKRAGDLPVYTVRPENRADVPTRTLHRDLLLPCSFLPACGDSGSVSVTPPRRPQTRSQKPVNVDCTEDLVEKEDEWDMPEVQIQPATFQFQSSGLISQPLPRAVGSPVFLGNPVVSVPDIGHLAVDGESSAESKALLPMGENELEPSENLSETERIPSTCVPENLQSEPLLSPPPISVEAPDLPDPVVESIPDARRSSRQRQPPNRLQYRALGNPLISVVQTLFHGFVDAYSEALGTVAATNLMPSRVYDV
ncbi:Retrovirus-related Pol polyprotein from transposon 412 [Collichthys lucidus]|uniref:Gypsy retrotransposon integrase-like protein 1 n=1 Tax=Collichthys lucidus TaxID=240159 RepID=A0A4U5U0C6_COLLU|nr:Retrovirus-related Pol polyprotein from transposon 412 [Collichthys lucidus]